MPSVSEISEIVYSAAKLFSLINGMKMTNMYFLREPRHHLQNHLSESGY